MCPVSCRRLSSSACTRPRAGSRVLLSETNRDRRHMSDGDIGVVDRRTPAPWWPSRSHRALVTAATLPPPVRATPATALRHVAPVPRGRTRPRPDVAHFNNQLELITIVWFPVTDCPVRSQSCLIVSKISCPGWRKRRKKGQMHF